MLRMRVMIAVMALLVASYAGGVAVSHAAAYYGSSGRATSLDGDLFDVEQRINYTQNYPGGTTINQTEIWIHVQNVAGSLASGRNSIYENDFYLVDTKIEDRAIYGWPMTFYNTPRMDYFNSWGAYGALTESIRSFYTADGAGWMLSFNCCRTPQWQEVFISY